MRYSRHPATSVLFELEKSKGAEWKGRPNLVRSASDSGRSFLVGPLNACHGNYCLVRKKSTFDVGRYPHGDDVSSTSVYGPFAVADD